MKLKDGLKRARKRAKVTQAQAAQAAGVSLSMYQFYEYGRNEPTANVLVSLADFFDVSLDYLTGKSDTPTVAIACAVPKELQPVILKSLFSNGIDQSQIVHESQQAAVVGDGFIIEGVSPKRAKDIAELIVTTMRKDMEESF